MPDKFNRFFAVCSLYRALTIAVVCFCLFFNAVTAKVGLLPNFTDEIILFLIFCYAVFKSKNDLIVRRALFIYCSLFALLVLMSINALFNRGFFSVFFQIFIHLKFILFFIFCWAAIGPERCLKLSYFFLIITVIFLFINLAVGNLFNELFQTKVNIRSGVARPIGIQADTAGLGTSFAFFGCLLICGVKKYTPNFKIVLMLLFTILILLASTRTALILMPLILLWWFKDSVKTFLIAFILLIFSTFYISTSDYMDELITITVENIEWTIDDPVASSYIRGIMIYFAVELAIDRFPLGTGASTYGTVMSDDSDIYAEIGLQNSIYFIEKEGIYDSNIASLLGEFGIFGLFIFLWAMRKVAILPMIMTKQYQSKQEFRFVLGILVLGYAITTPVLMNTYPAFLMALIIDPTSNV